MRTNSTTTFITFPPPVHNFFKIVTHTASIDILYATEDTEKTEFLAIC